MSTNKIYSFIRNIAKLMFLLIGIVSFQQSASAEEIGFDVQAILPENQLQNGNSYYDLRMKPGQVQEIKVEINNTSDEQQTYEININQAYTNKNGFIDYEQNVKPDSSLVYKISDIAVYDHELSLPPQSSTQFPITLTMPKESFDGEILAGIQIIKKTEQSQDAITNRYGYVLGLRLTETDIPVKRDLKLKKIEAAESFGSTSVVAKIQNPMMDAMGYLVYDVRITDLKDQKLIKKETYDTDMSIAPNSTYDFSVDWEEEKLKAGTYLMELTIKDAKGNNWDFSEEFNITSEEAEKVNQTLVPLKKENPPWFSILAGLVCGGLLLFLFFSKQKKAAKALADSTEEDSH